MTRWTHKCSNLTQPSTAVAAACSSWSACSLGSRRSAQIS